MTLQLNGATRLHPSSAPDCPSEIACGRERDAASRRAESTRRTHAYVGSAIAHALIEAGARELAIHDPEIHDPDNARRNSLIVRMRHANRDGYVRCGMRFNGGGFVGDC